MTQIEYDNVHKYLKAPSLAEIDAFIKELDITDAQFERYYKMPDRTISKIRFENRPLPKRFWHFIYEKIVPQYSLSFTSKTAINVPKSVPDKPKRHGRVNVNRLIDLG